MLNGRKLIIDTRCEVYNYLKDYVDNEFCNLMTCDFVPNSIYIVGELQFYYHIPKIKKIAATGNIVFVINFSVEGGETLKQQAYTLGLTDLIRQGKILLIGAGDMSPLWRCFSFETALLRMFNSKYINLPNIVEHSISDIYSNLDKPYKFSFLGGKFRWHRRQFLKNLKPLLDSAIWSNYDIKNGEIKSLDSKYEIDLLDSGTDSSNYTEWPKPGMAHLRLDHVYSVLIPTYIDSYFSVVCETAIEYPYSFRTEKIWKPIIGGHPWIALSNYGFYRDLQNMGFRTFNHLIDESFDLIENNQERLNRVTLIIQDLCCQDLAKFLDQCHDVCKYNQQHFVSMGPKIKKEFPAKFSQFLKDNQ